MKNSSPGKISANIVLPTGKSLINYQNDTVLLCNLASSTPGNPQQFIVTRSHFNNIAPYQFPALVRSTEKGSKTNIIFAYLWLDAQAQLIRWKIGELTDSITFEQISWKTYDQVPGVKNKGLGNQGGVMDQAWFEGAKRWVELLEKKKYKLLFPQDEVVGNQIYFARSTEPEMLTSNFTVPDAMLAQIYDPKRLPQGMIIDQPKFDGKRNFVSFQNGEVVNYSRGKKKSKSQYPHLKEQALTLFKVLHEKLGLPSNTQTSPAWLDGEIYKHGFNFQKLMTATQASINENVLARELNFVIYDMIDDGTGTQLTRLQFLELVFNDPRVAALPNIKLSPWHQVYDHSELVAHHLAYKEAGYEGLIVRDPNAFYVQKRVWSVMKMKTFYDEEWYIVGAEECTGTHAGAVKWILNTKKDGTGLQCTGVPSGEEIGTIESRRQQYQNRHMFMGTVASIKFFEKSNTGIPRHPNVIAYNRTDHI